MKKAAATKKTLAKTVAYRMVSTANTVAVSYWMTGSFKAAASLGVANVLFNSTLYFAFESVWTNLVAGGKLATA